MRKIKGTSLKGSLISSRSTLLSWNGFYDHQISRRMVVQKKPIGTHCVEHKFFDTKAHKSSLQEVIYII